MHSKELQGTLQSYFKILRARRKIPDSLHPQKFRSTVLQPLRKFGINLNLSIYSAHVYRGWNVDHTIVNSFLHWAHIQEAEVHSLLQARTKTSQSVKIHGIHRFQNHKHAQAELVDSSFHREQSPTSHQLRLELCPNLTWQSYSHRFLVCQE